MADLTDDPQFQAWADSIRVHLLPPLRDSALTLSLVPTRDTDIKFAVELGLSIMLDKPIIALIQPGTKVPERLVRVADAIVEYDPTNPDADKIKDAIDAVLVESEPDDA